MDAALNHAVAAHSLMLLSASRMVLANARFKLVLQDTILIQLWLPLAHSVLPVLPTAILAHVSSAQPKSYVLSAIPGSPL